MESLIFPITALIAAWILGTLLTKGLIPVLEKKQFRQFVRDEGPESHLKKTGTPSMGGIAIIAVSCLCAVTAAVIAGEMTIQLAAVLVAMVLFGSIGFIDDYEKAVKKEQSWTESKAEDSNAVCFLAGLCCICGFLCRRWNDKKYSNMDTRIRCNF